MRKFVAILLPFLFYACSGSNPVQKPAPSSEVATLNTQPIRPAENSTVSFFSPATTQPQSPNPPTESQPSSPTTQPQSPKPPTEAQPSSPATQPQSPKPPTQSQPSSPTTQPQSPTSSPSPSSVSKEDKLSMALSDVPSLRETCATVVVNPGLCKDLPVLRGPDVDACIDQLFGSSANGFLYMGTLSPFVSGNQSCASAVRKGAPQLLTQSGANELIFLRYGKANDSSNLAHEYGHFVFGRHQSQIHPEFLPVAGAPIMTDALVQEALEEEIRLETPTGREEKDSPGAWKEYWGDNTSYYADPREEFAFGFSLKAFYDEEHHAATVDDFIDRPLSEDRWSNGVVTVKTYIDVAVTWYYERLWERFVGRAL